jgi:hypothetical protein
VREPDHFIASTRPEDTSEEWQHLLRLCARGLCIGHGALDSFLSGPDLAQRVDLVVAEARNNATLRLELRDTLTMPQAEWSTEQHARLRAAARSPAA